jgi:hypothetical protein
LAKSGCDGTWLSASSVATSDRSSRVRSTLNWPRHACARLYSLLSLLHHTCTVGCAWTVLAHVRAQCYCVRGVALRTRAPALLRVLHTDLSTRFDLTPLSRSNYTLDRCTWHEPTGIHRRAPAASTLQMSLCTARTLPAPFVLSLTHSHTHSRAPPCRNSDCTAQHCLPQRTNELAEARSTEAPPAVTIRTPPTAPLR